MFEPAIFATTEDRIAAEVAMVEGELRRIHSRLRDVAWNCAAPPRRRTGNLSWSDVSFDRASAERDAVDDDAVVRQVLANKQAALQQRLGELRLQLTGRPGDHRRGRW